MSLDRAGAAQYAQRVNAAVELTRAGMRRATAVGVLATRFGVSPRQARRYVDQAAAGRRVVPETSVVLTVTLPASLAGHVREHAREAGVTISALVAGALEELPSRGRRKHPRE
jgi:hypothetical protein